MLDKAKAREIAINYSRAVEKILNPDRVVLFGSCVGGTIHSESDIDVAVFVRGLDEEAWYGSRVLLQKLRRNKTFLDIEPHLIDETDDVAGFAQHIMETGETIYTKEQKFQ